ncbi:MAG: SRPBCC family protein [Baekduia sp.]
MARISRSGQITRPPAEVWRVIADPRTLPEWWPGIERVEGVTRQRFTQLLRSSRGAVVRADFDRSESNEPRSLRWDQRVEGTPFAAVFEQRAIVIELEPAGDGTRVTLTVEQQLRGAARFSPQLNRGGVRRALNGALERLAAIAED